MTLPLLSLSTLAALLLAAAAWDLRRRRVPNALVLYGLLLGLALQVLAPTGPGLLQGGGLGLGGALLGAGAALALGLPLWGLRLLGAGDAKLLAMVGVWLGAAGVLQAALWTALAGGGLVLAQGLSTGTLVAALTSTLRLLRHAGARACGAPPRPRPPVTGRLPYAVAIAVGSGIEALRLFGAV